MHLYQNRNDGLTYVIVFLIAGLSAFFPHFTKLPFHLFIPCPFCATTFRRMAVFCQFISLSARHSWNISYFMWTFLRRMFCYCHLYLFAFGPAISTVCATLCKQKQQQPKKVHIAIKQSDLLSCMCSQMNIAVICLVFASLWYVLIFVVFLLILSVSRAGLFSLSSKWKTSFIFTSVMAAANIICCAVNSTFVGNHRMAIAFCGAFYAF